MPQPVPIAGYNSITTLTDPLIVSGGGGVLCHVCVYLCECVVVGACVCACALCGFA